MGKAIYTLGLSKIEVGATAEDGGMGESLAQLGYTYKDTCKMTQEDPETTDHYAEEVDDPVVSISRGGKTAKHCVNAPYDIFSRFSKASLQSGKLALFFFAHTLNN